MKRFIIKYFIGVLIFLFTTNINAQDYNYSLAIKGSYTTSSKIFLHPGDPDAFLRGKYLFIEDIFGGGVEMRRKISDTKIQIGISIEYIQKIEKFSADKIKDGFWAVPIELTGYFYIPITEKDINIFMGAGGGFYLGQRIYSINNVSVDVKNIKPGFGIQILSGVDYFFYNNFALRSQLKFRDIQFETTNQFDTLQSSETTQTNIDGMTVELGIVYIF